MKSLLNVSQTQAFFAPNFSHYYTQNAKTKVASSNLALATDHGFRFSPKIVVIHSSNIKSNLQLYLGWRSRVCTHTSHHSIKDHTLNCWGFTNSIRSENICEWKISSFPSSHLHYVSFFSILFLSIGPSTGILYALLIASISSSPLSKYSNHLYSNFLIPSIIHSAPVLLLSSFLKLSQRNTPGPSQHSHFSSFQLPLSLFFFSAHASAS